MDDQDKSPPATPPKVVIDLSTTYIENNSRDANNNHQRSSSVTHSQNVTAESNNNYAMSLDSSISVEMPTANNDDTMAFTVFQEINTPVRPVTSPIRGSRSPDGGGGGRQNRNTRDSRSLDGGGGVRRRDNNTRSPDDGGGGRQNRNTRETDSLRKGSSN